MKPAREVIASESQRHMSLAQLRNLVVLRWGCVLSDGDERYIRTSPDRGAIEVRFVLMHRLSFVVDEVFAGPPIREI